ncbi:15-hydroxyprostaglandin dehydrogenase [Eumeta japonica]|uniref:15-hydroxyprostaglandin dehydrogenase [NAD(+)] n=1 Tax=Eumeta variegata TaxID=151549 RepID=A0A4C1UYF1_EUMVA|nr:15-hydroxyprostaglandin dehydrogenase [Eumeta japonica]
MTSEAIVNKVFLVTGGAAGVGAGVCRALLAENARSVIIVDIAQREGATLESELNNKFGALRAKFIKCDIADDKQLSEAYGQVLDKYRRIDGVINNAAVLSDDDCDNDRMIGVNFTATVNSTLKAIKLMRADGGGHGGAVVNISSLLAIDKSPRLPVYSATKAAVLQFSNCIGMEPHYSNTKVRILSACLGPTDTAILHRHNLGRFDKGCAACLISRAEKRQSVESAALGVLEAIKRGASGSTWIIANDKPAVDVTRDLSDVFAGVSKKF